MTANGDLAIEPDEEFSINLTNAANAILSDGQGTATILNDDTPLSLSVNDVVLNEGDSGTNTDVVTVTLSMPSNQVVTVDYHTSDDIATEMDQDYLGGSGTLTFTVGQTSQWITITVNGDLIYELDETFFVSLYEAWKKSAAADTARFAATGGGERKGVAGDESLVDTRIGSGSDHTVFLNALRRPVVGLTFDGPYGVYHSMYDNYYWMNRFGDPGYRYHTLMSQLWGVLALRLANADVLPFDFGFYGRDIETFLGELCDKAGPGTAATGSASTGCRAGELDLGPAVAAARAFAAAGRSLKQAIDTALAAGPLDRWKSAALNRRIMDVESNWLSPDGIPGRPWFKHMLYAARYTYAHLELPGITEAVEKKDWQTARGETTKLVDALTRNTAMLREAASGLITP